MDSQTACLRCVGCRHDIPFAGTEGKCPQCEHPVADSVRRWKRFVDRDEGSVRGALFVLAISACVALPFMIASGIAGGFVDQHEVQTQSQTHPFHALQQPGVLFSLVASCFIFIPGLAAIIASLVLLLFSIRGVTYRVVPPLAMMAIGSVVFMFLGFVAGIVLAVYERDEETRGQMTVMASVISATIVVVLVYVGFAWMIDAMWSSIGRRVPLRPLLWIVVCALVPLMAMLTYQSIAQSGRPVDSLSGILRLAMSVVVTLTFSLILIISAFKVRRILGELAHQHRALELGKDPLARHRNAPPTFNQIDG